ncbi:MAG: sulfite exporter TauE/SafE family protein [Candidatus Nanopelagicales bacterium]
MPGFLLIAVVGLAAQLVDGSLGMGYGVTSSTLMIAIGLTPAVASASVHLAELGTTAASGLAHWRMGNVDWRTVRRIALPGALGAFAGATVLASLSTEAARPWASGFLFVLGIYVMVRFLRGRAPRRRTGTPGLRLLAPLGVVGGFVDATGGGGWGPVTTPTLLADGRMPANKVIGTVNTSEFLVSLAASIGFLLSLGTQAVRVDILLPLLIGGVIAAPIAAWVVHRLNTRILGVVVGGLIVFTNARTVLDALGVPGEARAWVYAAIVLAWVSATAAVSALVLRQRRIDAELAELQPVGEVQAAPA